MRASLIGLLLVLLANVGEAAITFQGTASTGGDTSSRGTYQAWTITPGGSGAAAGDLCVLDASLDGKTGSASWPTISVTGGQTWTTLFQSQTSSYARSRYWTVFNGTWTGGSISITSSDSPNGAFAINGTLNCFHPTSSSYTWSVDVTTSQAEYAAPGGSCDVTVTGQTPTSMASVVTIVNWMGHGGDVWALQTAGWTNPNSVTQIRNSYGGSNLSTSQAYKIQSSASATGNVTNRQTSGGCSAGWTAITTFKETSGSAPATGFVNRFFGFFKGAFAYNLGGTGTPPTNAIKWNPGFYPWYRPTDGTHLFFQLDQSAMLTDTLTFIDSGICPHANIKGVLLRVDMKSLEGDVHGDYSAGFTMVQTLLTHLAACSSGAKHLVLGVMPQIPFGFGDTRDVAYWPAYLLQPALGGTDTAGTYGVHQVPNGSVFWELSMWEPASMQAYIDLVIAYGQHFNASSGFEAIEVGWWGPMSAFWAPVGEGYTAAAMNSQWQNLVAAARGAWPNTGVKAWLDWFDNQAQSDVFMAANVANAVGAGGPDFVYDSETYFMASYTGESGNDRRGVVPWWDELSFDELCDERVAKNPGDGDVTNNLTYSQVFDYMINGNAVTPANRDSESPIPLDVTRAHRSSYIIFDVAYSNFPCGYGPQTWGANPPGWTDLNAGGALDFIQTSPAGINSTCPTSYTGGCM